MSFGQGKIFDHPFFVVAATAAYQAREFALDSELLDQLVNSGIGTKSDSCSYVGLENCKLETITGKCRRIQNEEILHPKFCEEAVKEIPRNYHRQTS
jgi:hypothetical protein